MIDFTEEERKKIQEILVNRNLRYSLSSNLLEVFKDGGCEITKYSDEWFTIWKSQRYRDIEYFICDEFEEVETYLNIML